MIACLCRAVAILTNHEIQTAKERHKRAERSGAFCLLINKVCS